MAGSLYMLRDFFRTGRRVNGGYMGESEDMLNATQRNLSLLSDAELLALRDSALLLVKEIEATHQERDIEDTCAHCGSANLGAFVCSDCGGSNLAKAAAR